jgi:hypothetical protein
VSFVSSWFTYLFFYLSASSVPSVPLWLIT